jgi:predicted PurR-regulated permease PerM
MEAPVAAHASPGLPVPSRRVLVLLFGIAVLAVLAWLGRDVLAPFVVGLLAVYLLDPVVERLARIEIAGRRTPRVLLISLVYLLAIVLVAELALLLVGPLVAQVQAFIQDWPRYLETLNRLLGEAFAWWDRLELPPDLRAAIDEALRDFLAELGSLIPAIVRPLFTSVLGLVGSLFGYLLIPVWVFWVLKDRPAIVSGFERSVPVEWRADVWAALAIVRRVFGSWIRGQLILGLVVGCATFLGLLLLGELVDPVFNRFAVLLAVIAGVFELLPVIGPILAAVPAVLLGATAGLPGIVAALLLYLAIQQLENHLLVPKVQGDATELHPAAVIFALILGGAIAGLLGAILALPLAATLRDLYVYAFRRAEGLPPEEAAARRPRAAVGDSQRSTVLAAATAGHGEAPAPRAAATVQGAAADDPSPSAHVPTGPEPDLDPA